MATQEGNARPPSVPVDGLLLLDKPAGMTSNQALQKVKRLLQARKAGHTGSLDPAATGMLPLCFGEATKVCGYLLDADKTYRVTARLGEATDTGDADGTVIATAEVPVLGGEDWLRTFASFTGEVEQVPPMYSALKQGGRRLYELARQGQVVERKARPIRVHAITLLEARGTRLAFRVHCSKGTYVRTLVEDLARAAGTVGHVTSLHRVSVAHFRQDDMLDLATATEIAAAGPDALRQRLLPLDSALEGWTRVGLDADDAGRFVHGQAVADVAGNGGLVRVYDELERFIGVGELAANGRLSPRRVFRPGSADPAGQQVAGRKRGV
ncbi:MAG: tRNA pseudouridine(55) synthase TruB [Gammaproteobacteria bacterium]|nr:tRNA pseudouridine(55) synthase TruB [Gammaproteobacteria bacterium]MDH4255977.1 tRNA pseudouridine(55) synthase TruB [Gammaproteobacteria bacterium]MDH5311301.1 tRNA pseudouridine(55) synthase TruB [Gammaproteobacteria bacterium]